MTRRSREPVRLWMVICLTVAAATIAAVTIPVARWHWRDPRPMAVLIVDKTAGQDVREHAGLVWVLEHAKITDPATDRAYTRSDFVGPLLPAPESGAVPARDVPRADGKTDLVYISDTYGLYDDRSPLGAPARPDELRYGGLSVEEVDRLVAGVAPGGTFIAEFNTVAGPTSRAARDRLESYLGFRWSGWAARHFTELGADTGHPADVPGWVPRQWSDSTGRDWPYQGSGWVFAHADGQLIVLAENVDIAVAGTEIRFDDASAARYGTPAATTYDYWFDIVEPTEGSTVDATYHLELTGSGARQLANAGIRADFPAIVRSVRPDGGTGYYFAGDWSDEGTASEAELGPVAYDGIVGAQQRIHRSARDDQRAFFWNVYQPLVDTIVTDTASRRQAREDLR